MFIYVESTVIEEGNKIKFDYDALRSLQNFLN